MLMLGCGGSSVGAACSGWSSAGSLSGREKAPNTNFHFSTMKIASQTRRRSKFNGLFLCRNMYYFPILYFA